jgi:hypothetical protein
MSVTEVWDLGVTTSAQGTLSVGPGGIDRANV